MLAVPDLKNNFDERIETFGIVLFKIIGCKIGQFINSGVGAAGKEIGNPAVLIGYFFVYQRPQTAGFGIAFESDGDSAGGSSFGYIEDMT